MKQVKNFLFMFVLLIGPLIMTEKIHAADQQSTQTNTEASVKAGDINAINDTPIVNPYDPDDITHYKGQLGIIYASHFDFGKIKLSGKDINVSPINRVPMNNGQTVPVDYAIETLDTRGTGSGWDLMVDLSAFHSTDLGESRRLKGAQLTLPVGQITTTEGLKPTGSVTPIPFSCTLDAEDQTDGQILLMAAANQGMGHWAEIWKPIQIHLQAPSSQYIGSYEAKLTWTLIDSI
ncbi:extracellular protein [Enterococcus mundtii 3F]|uniref:Cell surface protein n=2 Tax=Enterococcus faecium TaxID=1352 RepID=A0A0D5MAS2_ENTFC|nr:WxL domain-containing protein [Enterococcus mundtii]AJY53588.1 cell surface protein [Enterococcus faecium]MDA9462054.1 extracellular protein [Enterococcus mundtii 3F]